MQLRLLQFTPHLRQQHQHFLLLPPQHITKQPQRKRLQPRHDLRDVVHPDLLEVRILSPRADGQAESSVLDLGEPGITRPFLEFGAWARLAAGFA